MKTFARFPGVGAGPSEESERAERGVFSQLVELAPPRESRDVLPPPDPGQPSHYANPWRPSEATERYIAYRGSRDGSKLWWALRTWLCLLGPLPDVVWRATEDMAAQGPRLFRSWSREAISFAVARGLLTEVEERLMTALRISAVLRAPPRSSPFKRLMASPVVAGIVGYFSGGPIGLGVAIAGSIAAQTRRDDEKGVSSGYTA
jgi:hypothetical protein